MMSAMIHAKRSINLVLECRPGNAKTSRRQASVPHEPAFIGNCAYSDTEQPQSSSRIPP
jgi:hypothetical protein